MLARAQNSKVKTSRKNKVATLQSLTGPVQGQYRPEQGFPCVAFQHREKPVFISWDPCNENWFSLMEILHREIPVLITGVGLQFK